MMRTPPAKPGTGKGGKGSTKVGKSRDEPIVLRSNSQRQAEAAAAAGQASPREDAPASGSAAADQQRQQQQQSRQEASHQQQGQQQEQQGQQQQGQLQQGQEQQEQPEEGEVPAPVQLAEVHKALKAVQDLLATVSGDVLVVSESQQQLTAEMAELKRQQKGGRQQPPSAAGDHSSKVSALEAQVAAYGQKLVQMEEQLAEARTSSAAMQRVLAAAGLSVESDGKDMQEALSKGAQAWVEQQQLRDELKQLQQRLTRSEAHSSEQDGHISAARTSLGQLQQQAGLQASQVKFVVWAPPEYGPDKVMNIVASAAGVSIKAFTGGHNAFTPKLAGSGAGSTGRQAAGSSGGSAAGAGGNNGGGSGSGSGAAGSSGQQQQQQQQQHRGGGRQQLSLYVIQLSHQRYLPICLGGKCRMVLSGRQLPVYVDAALTDEERAERRRLAPLVQQLRAKQVRLRWKGAKLEQQVARAGGGKQWREVDPLPPAPAEDAAGQMAGGGAGEGQ